MAWLCTLCQRYIAGCYGNVLRHVKCHQYDENFQLKCGINSCQETYTTYESFRSHVYHKHREVLHLLLLFNFAVKTSQTEEYTQI